jgi:hypothetical protein
MISPDLGATLLFLAILAAGMILGFGAAVMAFGAQLPAIKEEQYLAGLKKGRALKHANVMHDIIANDTASTGADRIQSEMVHGTPDTPRRVETIRRADAVYANASDRADRRVS